MAMDKGSKGGLVTLSDKMTNPNLSKGSDFKVKVPAEGSGSEGMDQLFKDSMNQCGPRHTEDDGQGKGYGTPVPTDRSRVVASNFKEMKNSNETGTSLSFGADVSLGDGQWTGGVPYKK